MEQGIVSVKNDKSRVIAAAPYVMQILRKQKLKQAKDKLLVGRAWENKFNLVFTNEIGKHLSRNIIYRNFKKIVSNLGYGHVRFHDLRHTYAVVSIQAGDDIKTVQENLGHHTASFTLDTYAHVTSDMKKASADRMQNFIKAVI